MGVSVTRDIVESSVELRLETALVVLAVNHEVGVVANAFGHNAIYLGLECGGIYIVSAVAVAVTERPAVVKIDVGIGLQGAVGSIGAFADGVYSGKNGTGAQGFYFAHTDGVEVAENDIRNALGGNVAVVILIGIDVVGCPGGVLVTSRTFLVAGFHHLGGLVEEGANKIVEVILKAARVGSVVENDASQLVAGSLGVAP